MAKARAIQQEGSVEAFLRGFSNKLADPAISLPSTRCVTRPDLIRLLGTIRNELALPRIRSASATALLGILERSGLIKRIDITPLNERVRKDRFYAVGLDTDPALIDPAELLQAHEPEGVICYFSALQLHELTTQPAPHHHIAKVRAISDEAAPRSEIVTPGTTAPPLGSAQFKYQDVPYYVTARDSSILRKHQQRYLNAHSKVRVTTLEQTLIDTLHRPMSAGGPSIVFEAWNAAATKINVASVLDTVMHIGNPLLARRVGHMLERTLGESLSASTELFRALARENIISESGEPPSLIAFMPYKTIDARWQLLVP